MDASPWPPIAQVMEFYGGYCPPRHGWGPVRCPIHDDRTASASVNVDENRIYCHACGFSDTAIGIVMEKESMTFGEAKRFAAEKFGAGDEPVSRKPRRSRGLLGSAGDTPGSRPSLSARLRRGTLFQ